MSAYSNSSSKHFRAASFQQDSSAYSAVAPNDEFYNQNVGHVKRYLSKFDDLNEKTNSASKPQDSRTFSAQKNINDSSFSEIDTKCRENEDFTVKADMARRVSNLENKLQEMTQKVTREVPRQEDVGRINDRVSGLERRMDTMDRKLERLTTTLDTFMQKFQGQLAPQEQLLTAPDEKRSSLPYGNSRKEIPHETGERLTEIKLLGTNAIKNSEPEREIEQKSYTNAGHRRTQSRDGLDTRERVREALDQVRKKDDLALQDRGRVNMVEPKIFTVEQFERNKLVAKTQDKAVERFGTRESPEPKNSVPKQLKGSLRSPDTARKRKNVSWSENCVSEGNLEEEIGQKRNRMDTSDINDYGRYGFEQKSEILRGDENKYKPSNVRAYGAKEEESYEKQMKYISGEARTEKIKSEVEKLEEKLRKIERNENVNEKEKQLEEKRRKIDEEIQRRIDRQNEAKKRGDVSEVGQRRMAQFEDDLKTNSCNDISSYKDMGSRNELISKYSDITSSAAKRCKNT